MNNVLITGVAGFIGSNLAKWILKNHPEYTVCGIDNLTGGYEENLPEGVIFNKIDSADPSLKNLFKENRFKYVFHLASYAAPGISPFVRSFVYRNNILSTSNIIDNCVNYGVERLVFTSSMSVYGDSNGKAFVEDDTPDPQDPYAISKYASELDIKTAGSIFGLDWCILRPHNVYGEGQCLWDRYRNVFGIWMRNILNDEPILIYGDGEQKRAFTYIDDIMEPMWNAACLESASKEIINIGDTRSYALNECADIIREITGYANIIHSEARKETKIAVPDNTKAESTLGYSNYTDWRSGLSYMWEWAKHQHERKLLSFGEYEINKGINSYWK